MPELQVSITMACAAADLRDSEKPKDPSARNLPGGPEHPRHALIAGSMPGG